MKQKKKVLNKLLFVILIAAITYNFLFLLGSAFTKKEYLHIFGISFIPINNNLLVIRNRKTRTITSRRSNSLLL